MAGICSISGIDAPVTLIIWIEVALQIATLRVGSLLLKPLGAGLT